MGDLRASGLNAGKHALVKRLGFRIFTDYSVRFNDLKITEVKIMAMTETMGRAELGYETPEINVIAVDTCGGCLANSIDGAGEDNYDYDF